MVLLLDFVEQRWRRRQRRQSRRRSRRRKKIRRRTRPLSTLSIAAVVVAVPFAMMTALSFSSSWRGGWTVIIGNNNNNCNNVSRRYAVPASVVSAFHLPWFRDDGRLNRSRRSSTRQRHRHRQRPMSTFGLSNLAHQRRRPKSTSWSPQAPQWIFSSLATATKTTTTPTTKAMLFSTTTTTTTNNGDNDTDHNHYDNNEDDDDDWRTRSCVNPTLTFPTLRVPSRLVGTLLRHPSLQPYLARPQNWPHTILPHIHPRLKIVVGTSSTKNDHDDDDGDDHDHDDDDGDDGDQKLLLLWIPSQRSDEAVEGIEDRDDLHQSQLQRIVDSIQRRRRRQVEEDDYGTITLGPQYVIHLTYRQLSFGYVLNQLLVGSSDDDDVADDDDDEASSRSAVLPLPTSYEQVGRVAHFNLKPHHEPYKHLIGQVLLESATGRGSGGGGATASDASDASGSGDTTSLSSPRPRRISTVVNKVGHVEGKYRTFDYEILATTTDGTTDVAGNSSDGGNNNDPNHSLLETIVVEDGVRIHLNLATCYWCTRLSGERQEVLRDILGRNIGDDNRNGRKDAMTTMPRNLVVADVFCGVGAVCLLLGKQFEQLTQQKQQQSQQDPTTDTTTPTLTIVANDWNAKAINYLAKSAETNGLPLLEGAWTNGRNGTITRGTTKPSNGTAVLDLHNQDSYDFLIELGAEPETDSIRGGPRKSKSKTDTYQNKKTTKKKLPHHVLMNFPLEAPQFLGALRWWSWKRIEEQYLEDRLYPRFHVYTFARATRDEVTGRRLADDEEDVAVNLVANQLLPYLDMGVDDDDVDEENGNQNVVGGRTETSSLVVDNDNVIEYRRAELNTAFDANVSTRMVRDVAPGKVVVCVSFTLTPKLVRYMQGVYD